MESPHILTVYASSIYSIWLKQRWEKEITSKCFLIDTLHLNSIKSYISHNCLNIYNRSKSMYKDQLIIWQTYISSWIGSNEDQSNERQYILTVAFYFLSSKLWLLSLSNPQRCLQLVVQHVLDQNSSRN